MAEQPLLGRLVVVGGDQQDAVNACFLGLLGEFDGLGGGVGAGAGDDRDTLVHLLHHGPDHPDMLIVIQGGGLAGGAARYDGISSPFNLELHQLPQLFILYLSVAEWGDDGDDASLEHGNYLLWGVNY